MSPRAIATLLLALAVATTTGCGATPRPLVAAQDECEACRMTITDPRFGGEVITAQGRLRTFDSIECLASYVAAAGDSAGTFRGIWVADYETKAMVPATTARFVMDGSLHSPMGRDLAAFAEPANPAALQARYGGTILTWDEVRAQVGVDPHADARSGAGHGTGSTGDR